MENDVRDFYPSRSGFKKLGTVLNFKNVLKFMDFTEF